MGRVQRRMYRRRRKKRLLLAVVVMSLAVCAILLSRRIGFTSEILRNPATTAAPSAFDREVVTREVTLAAETWYAIQTGVFSTEDAALQKADAYTSRGAPGTVVQDGDKWRVFIAAYGDEADAAAVRVRLGESQRVDTYLYSWSCPELRLRLTGMAGQLDAVEAGFTLLSSTAAALRDTAILLDAGQLTLQEVSAQVNALDGQIRLWEETIRDRFGSAPPELVQGMLALTADWPAQAASLQEAAGSATDLSAALKAQGMRLYANICDWRKAIAAQ